MSRYKYLLFDADNTLFDFNKCEREAFRLALEVSPLAFSDEVYETYHVINDNLWKVLEKGGIDRDSLKVERYRQLFEKLGVEGDSYKAVADCYGGFLSQQFFEIDGVYELLENLSRDYPIYVITNGITATQTSRFAASRLTKFIKKIFISEEMGVPKPQPRFFDKVISYIGDEDRSHYLVIGDSLSSDIDGAINSGIDCCWYNRGGASPDGREPTYVTNDLGYLYEILK